MEAVVKDNTEDCFCNFIVSSAFVSHTSMSLVVGTGGFGVGDLDSSEFLVQQDIIIKPIVAISIFFMFKNFIDKLLRNLFPLKKK